MNTTKRATSILAALSAAVTVLSFRANAATYHVLPDDKLSSSDEGEVYNLMEALTLAEPGDHVSLGDGTYTTMHDRLKTTVDGKQSDPITIVGSRKAKLKAPSPSVRVEHSWITIKVRGEVVYLIDSRRHLASSFEKHALVQHDRRNHCPYRA